MAAFGLLLVVGNLLLAQVLGALALEIGIAARIQFGGATVQMQGVGSDHVQELAVMGDQQQGARVLEQPLFQPVHRIQVQMVGRFVQQQQVGGHHQRAGQVQACTPATGERGYRALVGIGGKAQPVQQLARTRLGVIGPQFGHLLMRIGHRLPVFASVGFRLFLQHRSNHVVAPQDIVDRTVRQGRGFLGHIGNTDLARQRDIALVGLQFAAYSGKQAGLAGAVTADHTNAVAGMQ